MKRKSKPPKPLVAGGLLGLAGLGLLPQVARASADLPPAVPDADGGAIQAEDPHPVAVPAPSAQTTEPQIEEQAAAHPTWSPETEHSAAVVAAAAEDSEPTRLEAEMAIPEGIADSSIAGATEAALTASELAPPDLSPAATAVPAAASLSTPTGATTGLSDRPHTTPAVDTTTSAAAEPLSAMVAKPANAKPLPLAALEPDAQVSPINRESGHEAAIAPEPAPVIPTVPAAAAPTSTVQLTPRRTTPKVAALQSRAATVQTLLRDLRSTYGLENSLSAIDITAAPANAPASLPPTAHRREPQLPSLRSARRGVPPEPQRPEASHTMPEAVSPAGPEGDRSPTSFSSQLPLEQPANVALALPIPQPVMSTGQTAIGGVDLIENSLPSSVAATPAVTIAQGTASEADAAQIRDQLRIEPLTTTTDIPRTFPPSPNAGIPSGFGANWGDLFIGLSLSGADRLRPEADGSLTAGFGLGDSRRLVGVELAYNLLSMRRFGENGGFDVKVHRQVHSSDETQVAAAVGLNNFASYGPEAGGSASSLYGVVTVAQLLQPEHPENRLPITASVGLGGGSFAGEGSDVGLIAGVGLQVHPQFSVNTAWSGVGVNVGASIVPVPTLPLTLNLLYGDVGNNTPSGSVAVLSIGYGFNFGPRF
ncbi:hypothetical protein [Leptolyngbya sp. KIOST-1]|uniref:hypothetical protein n=1 Tax=Leptolyngbya sp. KIOST-1 TaxID=1229172 RepID=UPI00068FC199|nr:hypothetical protein [Leptolyngbya sp. KIOST-1]